MKVSELERQLNLVTTQASTTQLKKQKKKSRKKGINSRAKGGRVERELVAWLKERGIASAERTAQRCGKGGPSDVVAKVELPSFHIEVKGTAGANLSKSTLIQWLDQIRRDCVNGQIPIIFHKANGEDWVALFCESAIKQLDIYIPAESHIVVASSFNPTLELDNEYYRMIFRGVNQTIRYSPQVVKHYPVVYAAPDIANVIATEATVILDYMKAYEQKAKGIAA